MRRLALIAVVGALTALPARAQQGGAFDTYLNAAIRLYESLEYERALEQLEKAKKLSRGVEDDVTSSLYEGLVRMDLGQLEQARAAFKTALLLKVDAPLPPKVSPKVHAEVEQLREQVKKELAPMLAKQAAEREKKDAEARRRAEEEAKRAAERNREAREAEARERNEELVKKQQVLRAQQQEADARKAADAPRQVELAPLPSTPGVTVSPPPRSVHRAAIVGFVAVGLGVASAATATYFGIHSRQQVDDARGAQFQDDAAARLGDAQTSATVANVLFGVAVAAAVTSLVGFLIAGLSDAGPME